MVSSWFLRLLALFALACSAVKGKRTSSGQADGFVVGSGCGGMLYCR
jgi:hypothetical protein